MWKAGTGMAVVSLAMAACSAFSPTLPSLPFTQQTGSCCRASTPLGAFPKEDDTAAAIPACVESTVLRQAYPAMAAHQARYGNPNIPLGSTDGKRCKTLRRLHFQNKLSEAEVSLLSQMGFRFHSFEDVYFECDFDEMLDRLLRYQRQFHTFQIPKKYDPDPELGAWVTMLRRLRRTDDLPEHQIAKLDAVGFEWISTRKCGSSFMKNYRDVLQKLQHALASGENATHLIRRDEQLHKWILAQKLAFQNGNLSDSRVQYMDELPGVNWRELDTVDTL